MGNDTVNRETSLRILLTEEEKRQIRMSAASENKDMSQWARDLLLQDEKYVRPRAA